MCSYVRPGCPGYRDLGFCDRDLGNRDENVSYEHSSPVTGTKLFLNKIASLSQHNFGLVCISTLEVSELALLVRYKSPQTYDSREQYKFMFLRFGCVS